MKLLLILSCLFYISCVNLKPNGNKKIEDLAKKESFRYDLPIKEEILIKPNFPNITTKKLSTGLSVYVLSRKDLPIVSLNIVFKAGSSITPNNKPGVINLLALMLKEGSKDKTSLQMANAFADLGTQLEVNVTFDRLSIGVDCTSDKLEAVSKLLSDILENPQFLPSDFLRVKENFIAELESIQAIPGYKAQKEFFNTAYTKQHPYGKSIIDNPKDIENISIDDVKNAYNNYFGSQNAALIIVGDTDYKDIEKKSASLLKFNKKIIQTSNNYSYINPKEMQIVLVEQEKTPQRSEEHTSELQSH